jgi:hypothetical protein
VKADEAVAVLRRRYPSDKGKWAVVREFLGVDLLAVCAWASGDFDLHGHELKVSRADWLRELRKPTKADAGMARCDYWWLAAPPGVAYPQELPEGWGFLELRGQNVRRVTQAPRLSTGTKWRVPYRHDHDPTRVPKLRQVYDRAMLSRETVAMLARRITYAEADRAALIDAWPGDEETKNRLLDQAAQQTGRVTSEVRRLQKEHEAQQRRYAAQERQHARHRKDGQEIDPECPICKLYADVPTYRPLLFPPEAL